MRICHVAQSLLCGTNSDKMSKLPLITKEVFRRLLASALLVNPAQILVARRYKHPLGLFCMPPEALPPKGMEAASNAFVNAGRHMASGEDVSTSLSRAFERVGKREAGRLVWSQNWICKGTLNVPQPVTAVSACLDVWTASYRCNFLPLWAHCSQNSVRCSRTDKSQFESLRELTQATRLVELLSDDDMLRAQRAALKDPSSGLFSIEQAAQALGISEMRGILTGQMSRDYTHIFEILASKGAHTMAMLLAFSRVAALNEGVLFWDLGAETKGKQIVALHKRLQTGITPEGSYADIGNATNEGHPDGIPKHASYLYACVQCRRVANAFCGWDSKAKHNFPFNELGVTSSMNCVDCASPFSCHMRCAKRVSASLRQAQQTEALHVEKRAVDLPVDINQCNKILMVNSTKADAGVAQRIRRDSKTTYEQTNTTLVCGDEPMVSISILGRALRIYGEWYALCSLCGVVVRVTPESRFGAEICCMRCDMKLLKEVVAPPELDSVKMCRFCGKVCGAKVTARATHMLH
jgi:hypothetical protein